MFAVSIAIACSRSNTPATKDTQQPAAPPAVAAAPGDPKCPQTGLWAECSLIYRLERAGLVPSVDSTAKPAEKTLTGRVLMLKIGLSAQLEVHFYPDSATRAAEASKLDRSAFVSGTGAQTIKREKTLIESVNVIGLLTSINAHQRERVSDALLAGPPQPPSASAQTLKPVVTRK